MKKILFILLFIPILLNANPTWLGFNISEIYFDESGQWQLEIDNEYVHLWEYLDSLVIESNSGRSSVRNIDTTRYIIIKNENLSKPITINKNGDCIKLYTCIGSEFKTDSICIGEMPGSYLKNIKDGQSIARYYNSSLDPFYKDNSPTIGSKNDFEGSIGKIYGHFYDTVGELIKNKYFFINEGYCTEILLGQGDSGGAIRINEDGFYCAEITSRGYSINETSIYSKSTSNELMKFKPIEFDLNVGDSLNIDFKSILTSTKTIKQSNILLSNYPNPAKDYTYFLFSSSETNLSSYKIEVYSLNGELIGSFTPNATEYLWDCSNLPQGTYIYILSQANKLLGRNKFQIVK